MELKDNQRGSSIHVARFKALLALSSTLFRKNFRLLCAPRNVIFQNTFEKRLHARDCRLIFVIEIQVAHAVPVTRGYLKQLHALA